MYIARHLQALTRVSGQVPVGEAAHWPGPLVFIGGQGGWQRGVMCGIIELSPIKAPSLLGRRGEVLPGGLVTRSGISIVARDGRLVKGGFFGLFSDKRQKKRNFANPPHLYA